MFLLPFVVFWCLAKLGHQGVEANSQEDGSQDHLKGRDHDASGIHRHHRTQHHLQLNKSVVFFSRKMFEKQKTAKKVVIEG